MQFSIPVTSGDHLQFGLEPGQTLYILGANGVGKSALLLELLAQSTGSPTRWLSARRQVHLATISGTQGIMLTEEVDYRRDTSEVRQNIFENQLNKDFTIDGRWQELEPEDRLTKPLFELVTRENQRARIIADRADHGDLKKVKDQAANLKSPVSLVNQLLRQSGFKISLTVGSDGKLQASKQEGSSYDFAYASDGERSAVIAAATVLTAPEGAVILIDEPDRHLHRSVIVPFMSALSDMRNDCIYIVSTYETALPNSHRDARLLVVRSCTWTDGKPAAWDLNEIQSETPLPEEVRAAVLGARTKTILVEGIESSLDSRLYSILLPDAGIKSIGGHGEVESAVSALRRNREYTHIEAYGIVDGDGRPRNSDTSDNRAGVYLLDAYCVECLYYCEVALAAVAEHQAPIIEQDAEELTEQVKQEVLTRLAQEDTPKHMAARRSWSQIKANIVRQTPSWQCIAETGDPSITIEVESPYQSELQYYRQLLQSADFDALARRYPIYKTNALDPIPRVLRLADREAYVDTLLYLVMGSGSARRPAPPKRVGAPTQETYGILGGSTSKQLG